MITINMTACSKLLDCLINIFTQHLFAGGKKNDTKFSSFLRNLAWKNQLIFGKLEKKEAVLAKRDR